MKPHSINNIKNHRCILLLIPLFFLLLWSCGGLNGDDKVAKEDRFHMLLSYMETEKDYIHSEDIPFFISAPELYELLDSNVLVMDLRDSSSFNALHIPGAVNVPIHELLSYMEHTIHAPSFDRIVLTCGNGFHSVMGTLGLKYLGYDNVYPLRLGLSSWDESIANDYWLNALSSHLTGKLSQESSPPKSPPGSYPVLMTSDTAGYQIMRQRIDHVFSGDFTQYFTDVEELIHHPDSYYVISYWPEERFSAGHLPGSHRYQPKQSLRSEEHLSTLPIDKPVVIQCYSGNHASFAAFYLRLLGYDARPQTYGANAFIHDIMKAEEPPRRFFNPDKDIFNFPVDGESVKSSPSPKDLISRES